MDFYSKTVNQLIEELSRLPGIGAKSAQRLAFHIINMPKEQVEQLAQSMVNARSNIRYCKECFTLTDQELCPICSSAKRDKSVIMVVETSRDLAAYEKNRKNFDGVYHVLHGGNFSYAWNRTGRHLKIKGIAGAPAARRCARGDYCDKFQSGRRSNSDVYKQINQASWH